MRAEAQEKTCELWVGMDVSKARFEAAVVGEEDGIEVRRIVVQSFARTRAGVRAFLEWATTRTEEVGGRIVSGRFISIWLNEAKPSVRRWGQ